jgi:hypothetical protein
MTAATWSMATVASGSSAIRRRTTSRTRHVAARRHGSHGVDPSPLRHHEPDQLGGEERVALGALLDRGGHVGVDRPAGRDFDQLGRRRVRQAAQEDPAGPRRPRQRRQCLHHAVVASHLELADGAHQEHRAVDELARNEGEQLQRRGVRPLQVVEHEHQLLVVRGLGDEARDRVEQLESGAVGDEGGVGTGSVAARGGDRQARELGGELGVAVEAADEAAQRR